MKVLIKGAAGFIGRHVVERWFTAGEHKKTFVHPSTKMAWLEGLGVEVRP